MNDNNKNDFQDLELKQPYYQCGIYAITINPNDTFQKISSVTYEQFTDSVKTKIGTVSKRYNKIENTFEQLLKDYKYKLWWDVSCPTDIHIKKFPRLHLHGIIYLSDSMLVETFLLKTSLLLSQISSIKMTLIEGEDNLNKWLNYCTKYTNIIRRHPMTNKY